MTSNTDAMIFIIFVTFVIRVECGLFQLASRQRSSNTLWEQVKALERVNTFLEDVQEEVKESRDLLRHINYRNFYNYAGVNASLANQTSTVISNLTVRNDLSTMTTKFVWPLSLQTDVKRIIKKTTKSKTRSKASTKKRNAIKSPAVPTTKKRKSIKSPAVKTTKKRKATKRISLRGLTSPKAIHTTTTSFSEDPPSAFRSPVIPDIEPDYKEILPYFRDEGRPVQVNHDRNTQNLNHKISKADSNKRTGNDYAKGRTKTICAYMKQQHFIQNVVPKTLRTDNKAETNASEVFYNKGRHFGQKRFNVVTPIWIIDPEKDKPNKISNDTQAKRHKDMKILNLRPIADINNPNANISFKVMVNSSDSKLNQSLVTLKPRNEHLRKIIEDSSYSDEETALKVNLLDHLFHYNKTFKEDAPKNSYRVVENHKN